MTEPLSPNQDTDSTAAQNDSSQSESPQSESPQAPQDAAEVPQHEVQAPQPQVAQRGYAPQPPQGGYAPQAVQAKTNTLAIVSLVAAFFVNVVGIVCGHIALSQIKRTGERGRGFAIAGLVLGYLSVFFMIIGLALLGFFISKLGDLPSDLTASLEESYELLPEESDEGVTEVPDAVTSSGGEYSAEFCAALEYVVELVVDDITDAQMDEAFAQLAAIPSPNQSVYQRFYEAAMSLEEYDEDVLDAYMDAVFDDATECYMR